MPKLKWQAFAEGHALFLWLFEQLVVRRPPYLPISCQHVTLKAALPFLRLDRESKTNGTTCIQFCTLHATSQGSALQAAS
jgi:hypothetical protein